MSIAANDPARPTPALQCTTIGPVLSCAKMVSRIYENRTDGVFKVRARVRVRGWVWGWVKAKGVKLKEREKRQQHNIDELFYAFSAYTIKKKK